MSLLLGFALVGCDLFRRLPKDGETAEVDDSSAIDTSNDDTDTAEDSAEDSGEPSDSAEPVIDDDLDGYTDAIDCNDRDANVHPGAMEVDFDGWDNNCDGLMLDNGCVYVDVMDAEVRVWIYDRTSGDGAWVDGAQWASGVIDASTNYRVCAPFEFVVGHTLQVNGIFTGPDGAQDWLVGAGGASHITRVTAGNFALNLEPSDIVSTPACSWTDNGMGGGDLYCGVTFEEEIEVD